MDLFLLYIHVIYLLICFKGAWLALGQSYDCSGAIEANLQDMGMDNYVCIYPQPNMIKCKPYA